MKAYSKMKQASLCLTLCLLTIKALGAAASAAEACQGDMARASTNVVLNIQALDGAGSVAEVHPPGNTSQQVVTSVLTPATTNAVVNPPAVPDKIRSILHSDWAALDPDGEAQMEKAFAVLRRQEFQEFAHARDVFKEHLTGVFGILSAWGCAKEITRAGLFHTGYSGDSFIFHYFSSESANDRAELRAVIGTEAERLTHLFGTMDRSVVNRSLFELRPNETLSPLPRTIRARGASGPGVGTMVIPPQDQAAIMLITVADYLDQMVSVNGWKHVHQEEGTAMAPLYPGSGKPEIAFFWFSRVCRGLVPFLEIVPPIFNHCTEELTHADETRARDLYWSVMSGEEDQEPRQVQLLQAAVALNPFIAEPHVQLSQLFYRAGRFAESMEEAKLGLKIFYTWASCWDKRIPYRQWVAFTRMLFLRASRRAAGLEAMPFENKEEPNFHHGPLVSLKKLVGELQA